MEKIIVEEKKKIYINSKISHKKLKKKKNIIK